MSGTDGRQSEGDAGPSDDNGIPPPSGCVPPKRAGLPKTAVPTPFATSNKEFFCGALGISLKDFDEKIISIILGNKPLETWFACRMTSVNLKRLGYACRWPGIQGYFDGSLTLPGQEHEANAGDNVPSNAQRDDLQYAQTLYIRAVLELVQQIRSDPVSADSGDDGIGSASYQSDLAKAKLAHDLLLFLHAYIFSGRTSIIRPPQPDKATQWAKSPYGKVGVAIEQHAKGKI